jgi:hypothetical protein
VLPLAAKTHNDVKRARFAKLLARAATTDLSEQRDSARTMALILDQLEYAQVRALDTLVGGPGQSRNQDTVLTERFAAFVLQL